MVVVAKAPEPGQAKTRLAAGLDARAAAELAAAALLDTLQTAREADAASVVALTGDLRQAARRRELERALADHLVIAQRGRGLAERLANADADAARAVGADAVVQVGMDTPQLSVPLLSGALAALAAADAALGPAEDGGWWCLAVHDPALAACLVPVPMSRPDTGERTYAALRAAGATVAGLPRLRDVDTLADALAVAGQIPHSQFAAAVAAHAAAAGSAR